MIRPAPNASTFCHATVRTRMTDRKKDVVFVGWPSEGFVALHTGRPNWQSVS